MLCLDADDVDVSGGKPEILRELSNVEMGATQKSTHLMDGAPTHTAALGLQWPDLTSVTLQVTRERGKVIKQVKVYKSGGDLYRKSPAFVLFIQGKKPQKKKWQEDLVPLLQSHKDFITWSTVGEDELCLSAAVQSSVPCSCLHKSCRICTTLGVSLAASWALHEAFLVLEVRLTKASLWCSNAQ